jgi:hypothetical protein
MHRLFAGLLFFRHSKNTSHFIDEWQAELDRDSKVAHCPALLCLHRVLWRKAW